MFDKTIKKTKNLFFCYFWGWKVKYPEEIKATFSTPSLLHFSLTPKSYWTFAKVVIGESSARKCFAEFDKECFKALLKKDGHQTTSKLVKKMNCDHKTIVTMYCKYYEFGCQTTLVKTYRKLPSNCFATSRPSSCNTRS